jgi:hypothetical protein
MPIQRAEGCDLTKWINDEMSRWIGRGKPDVDEVLMEAT